MCTAQGVVSGLFPKDVEAGTMDVDVSLNGSNEYMVLNGRHCARLAELFRKGCDLSSAYLPDSARAVAKAVESGAESWMRDGPWKVRALTLYTAINTYDIQCVAKYED